MVFVLFFLGAKPVVSGNSNCEQTRFVGFGIAVVDIWSSHSVVYHSRGIRFTSSFLSVAKKRIILAT